MSNPLAEIDARIAASVEANTNFTTCPVCLGGVDPTSMHKEPYVSTLPGDAAETLMDRHLLHTQQPDGSYRTTSVLDYP